MINLYEVKAENKDFVHSWEFISLGHWNNHRLYYKKIKGDKEGFYFQVLSFAQGPAIHDGKTDIWSRETMVDILMSGVAYWDGLRHVFVTPEEKETAQGYMYLPNAILMIEIWDNLRQLEQEYCRENDGNKY